jgi:hypothetical protein
MNPTITRALTAMLALSASVVAAQTSGPVAYIYVSSNYSGSNNRVAGYAASADGKLTHISGSPWADNLSFLATNGSLLFGSTNIANDNGKNIFSYRVESNGALKYIGATNIQDTGSSNPDSNSYNACNDAKSLTLDHTGSYLYAFAFMAACNTQWEYQSFAVNKSTGLLNYLGVTQPNAFSLGSPLTMLADNNYAYAAGGEDSEICGFNKAFNGNLVNLSCNTTWPAGLTDGQPSGSNGNVYFATSDPTNHFAIDMNYTNAYSGAYIGDKIATITVNTANGATSSTSTYNNMPETETPVSTMKMAPGGKLLAVGGSKGIQIFNFHPSGQATKNTGLITTAPITALYWDNSNHLYAISNADSALHVFTVTATSVKEALGSPYPIPRPVAMTGHSM